MPSESAWRRLGLASAGICGVAAVLLWPQIVNLNQVPDLGDPLFSIWRFSWVFHKLQGDPRPLFSPNIFYPHEYTLTYSDSMLLPAVTTMPLLRAKELGQIIDKARITHALCEHSLRAELEAAAAEHPSLAHVRFFNDPAGRGLDADAARQPESFDNVATAADDTCILGFTSGTTGKPKATMHFHRDLLIIADGYAKEVLGVTPDDIFVGSPPLAFTFGLGGLAIFPLRFGATATLLETASPPNMLKIIETYKATICFTAPTAYLAMLRAVDEGADVSSLRIAVSAGETLPAPVYKSWEEKVGKPILDGIGSTEMLHIFISNHLDDRRPGATGTVCRVRRLQPDALCL